MNRPRLKKPTDHRLFIILALWSWPASSHAQQASWTAEETVAHVLANPERAERLKAEQAARQASMEAALLLASPRLAMDQEQVFGSSQVGYSQLTVRAEQQFDLSGWRQGLRDAAPHYSAAIDAQAAMRALDDAQRVKLAFYAVRYREERLLILEHRLAQLERAVRDITARAEVGDASPYEQLRIERERELALTQRALEAGLQMDARGALHALTLWPDEPALSGALRPAQPRATSARSPLLRALEQESRALELERDAWGAPMWRDWAISAGYRHNQVGDSSGHGFIITLSLPLALWNSDQPRQDQLQARRAQLQSALRVEQRRLDELESRSKTRLVRAMDALNSGVQNIGSDQIIELSELAYSSGEISLVELLDLYRVETDLMLARLDLEWDARQAALELKRFESTGEVK